MTLQKDKIIDEYVHMINLDLDLKISYITKAYLEFLGYEKDEVVGKPYTFLIDKTSQTSKNLIDTVNDNKTRSNEQKKYKFNGEDFWAYTTISPLYDNDDIKVGYYIVKKDITHKKRLKNSLTIEPITYAHNEVFFDYFVKRELKQSLWKKQKFALLIIEIDNFIDFKSLNSQEYVEQALKSFAFTIKKSVDESTENLFKISDREFAIVILDEKDENIKLLANNIVEDLDKLNIKFDPYVGLEILEVNIGAVNIDNYKYNINNDDIYNIANNNLCEAKASKKDRVVFGASEDLVKKLTNIDPITKLSNRVALIHDISLLQEEGMLILLHVNQIDSLKNIYGRDVIDSIIVHKAQLLSRLLIDKGVFLYNLNNHEFAILVTDKTLFEKYFLILKYSILVGCCDTFTEDTNEDFIVADFTAGVAYGKENLFNNADVVLQEAIISNSTFKIYEDNSSTRKTQKSAIKNLKVYKKALHNGNIIPYFQPIINLKDNTVHKYEALARIKTETGEIITPYYFLKSAVKDNTFEYFSRQMMQKVFNIYEKSKANISINLTYENVSSKSMMEYVKNRLDKYGGEGITFELVESEDIKDYSVIEDFILLVKKYGCKVSIDDFGSGYSNFTNVIKLNIDYIKIDGALVERLNEDENVVHMIEALLVFAKSAKIQTIAEYVSTKEILQTVKKLGIDYSQGYFYGEPRHAEDYGLI